MLSPDDVIWFVLADTAVGLLGVTWLAGWWSVRKNKAWLRSPDSRPFKEEIAEIAAEKVREVLPSVPTVAEIAAEVEARLPDLRPQVRESITAELPRFFDELGKRTGLQVQAAFASMRNEQAAFSKRLANEGIKQFGLDPQKEFLVRLVERSQGKETGETARLLIEGYELMKARGHPGQQNGAPQWTPGMVSPDGRYFLTQNGWVPVGQPQPQPQYPGWGYAPLGPGLPPVQTPGAGAPANYVPDVPSFESLPELIPAKDVPKRIQEKPEESKAEPALPSS